MDWERNDVVIKEWFLYYYLNYFNWSIAARNNKKSTVALVPLLNKFSTLILKSTR